MNSKASSPLSYKTKPLNTTFERVYSEITSKGTNKFNKSKLSKFSKCANNNNNNNNNTLYQKQIIIYSLTDLMNLLYALILLRIWLLEETFTITANRK
jgi:hypothetical protein